MMTATNPEEFVAVLDRKVEAILRKVEETEAYKVVAASDTDPRFVVSLVKYIMAEVYAYGRHITEASFTAIGRLPKHRTDLMRRMALLELEEADHGEMALRDAVRVGADEKWVRSRRMAPASFVMGAIVRMLGERENPFSYLGYMYVLEGTTPVLTERAQQFLAAKGFPAEAREFIDLHAVADVAHTEALRKMIKVVITDYPEAMEVITFAFDCAALIYPIPIWATALDNAKAEYEQSRATETSC